MNKEDADTTEYGTIRFLYNRQLGVVTDDNGLYYMRARYYNPDIKRFINQDILTGNISNNASLNRYSYVEGNPVSYTDPFGLAPFDFVKDKIDVSTIIHAALDILGTLPYGDIFDIINAGVYLMEENYEEAIKSLIFAVPGIDLAGKSAKYAAKGGKYATAAAEVLNTLNTMDKLACVYYVASDFGTDMAYIIYKYGYEKAAFSAETLVEMLSLTAHAIQLGHYSNPFMDTDLTPYIENAWNDIVGDNSLFGESGNAPGVGNPVKIAGRGSTGRTVPNTLNEQMAMHQVKSNPLEGATDLSQLKHPIIMTDPRWPASEGWVKMSNNVNGIEIHFLYNKITGEFDDFKFK